MTITRNPAQDQSTTATAATVSVAYPGTPIAGDLLVAIVFTNAGPGTTTMTGWTMDNECQLSSGSDACSIWHRLATGTEGTISASSTGATVMSLMLFEASGNANPIVVESSATVNNQASATTGTTGPITTSQAGDALFEAIAMVANNGGSGSPPWASGTNLLNNAVIRVMAAIYIPGTTLSGFSDTAKWTTTRAWGSVIVAYEAAGAASGQGDMLAVM